MIQLVCSILALAGSWLAFTTGGIAAGALDNAIEYGRTVRRAFWYVLYLMTVGLAADPSPAVRRELATHMGRVKKTLQVLDCSKKGKFHAG